MCKSDVAESGVQNEMFYFHYCRAKQLALQDNDVAGAWECLAAAQPEGQAELWYWTDLGVALLFRLRRYEECHILLTSYQSHHPDHPGVATAMKMLQRHIASPP